MISRSFRVEVSIQANSIDIGGARAIYTEDRTNRSGPADIDLLVAALKRCGFCPSSYLDRYPDLQRAGLTEHAACLHYLNSGVDEGRSASFGEFPSGLADLLSLPIPDKGYVRRLFRAIYEGQLGNPATVKRLWSGIDDTLIASLTGIGGIPYIVIGDSHTNHYKRFAWADDKWLAPLPLACVGRAAIDLFREGSPTRDGEKILAWAQATVSRGGTGVPVFLKFGGIDAEYRWVCLRLEKGIEKFSPDEFDEFARGSVAQYGQIVDRLLQIIEPAALRICAVFPAVLLDDGWREHFAQLHRFFLARDQRYENLLQKLEIPNLTVRTKLRALYNRYLRQLCEARGLTFVDDFSPLLNDDGVLDARYVPVTGAAQHIDYAASEGPLLSLIWNYALN